MEPSIHEGPGASLGGEPGSENLSRPQKAERGAYLSVLGPGFKQLWVLPDPGPFFLGLAIEEPEAPAPMA